MISFSNKEYFRLYIWRFTSIISGFLSKLVVVPHISEEQELFGVYSVVMSIALYLTYSDLGFLSAGQKYAAESYANGNRDNEYRIIGFTIFLLLVMSVPFTVTAYFVSLNPTVIISELSDNAKIIASRLFFIIAFLLPVQVLLQRLVQSILSIRLKDYLYLRIDFFSNLIKITSTFWFFKSDYLLVEFVAFSILLTILSQIFILINFKTRHSYEILQVLREVKFSLDTYNKVSKLAYSSLLVTLSWILYYELDLVFIGRWLGARQVAIYAVAFSFLNFTRTFWNALYSPFAHRFNHLTGDDNSFLLSKNLLQQLMERTFLVTIIVGLVLIMFSESIIYSWVGEGYSESIAILRILLLGTFTVAINKPISYFFTAQLNYKYLYVGAATTPGVFILSLLLLVPSFGLVGFAIAKTLAVFSSSLVAIIFVRKVYQPLNLFKIWHRELVIVTFSLYMITRVYSLLKLSVEENSMLALIAVFISITLVAIILIFILFLYSKRFKNIFRDLIATRRGIGDHSNLD